MFIYCHATALIEIRGLLRNSAPSLIRSKIQPRYNSQGLHTSQQSIK